MGLKLEKGLVMKPPPPGPWSNNKALFSEKGITIITVPIIRCMMMPYVHKKAHLRNMDHVLSLGAFLAREPSQRLY